MTIKRVFCSSIKSSKYLMPNGKEIPFINGEYMTDQSAEILMLEAEIAAGHPHIHVNPEKKEVDTDRMDPLEEIRRKAVADYIASMSAATQKDNDMGKSEPGKLNIATSATVGEGAVSSDSSASSAVKLIPLPAAKKA